ncbi:uncharacterized protein PSANT_00458 [Moesziomyces antarcticus]|uniref:Uncharacterized protein n=2 Tax=Pseudozyma antarctica TaxID=84753 RepID=A0A5C3FGE9_PSEA2|nr:uncharacterized protein PSANT_00458 [Moesziomyces antarcticus]
MPSAAARSGNGSPPRNALPPASDAAPTTSSATAASLPPPSSSSPVVTSASTSASASASASQAAAAAAASSSSSPLARQSPKARPRPLNNQHHPYRIELLDLTPVSVSLLWSTRPPPLSAIPLEVVNSQLRKRVRSRTPHTSAVRSSSPHSTSARATAVSPSPTSATSAAVNKTRSAPGAQHASDANPISKLTDGLVATRSLNRKVTKIRLRAPPTVPAQPRRSSNSSAPSDSAHNSANDDDAWPSDDGATAVDDEAGSASDASDSGYEGASDARHHIASVFKDRVSVTVNGQDWSHVLLGERGSHEAIVVIFGLEPESDYDIQFLVKAGLDGAHDAFRASFRTRADRDPSRSLESSPAPLQSATSAATSAVRPASPSPLGRVPLSAPELDPVEPPPQRLAVLQAELEASEALKASLIAEVKRARKESSKQEAGLRHEIDAVKRGMDRMSATDHRSRQKVLALQELIKQTTIHTKEIHEEAEQTETQQPDWEQQDSDIGTQVDELRSEVEAEEAAAQAEWDKDEAALAALEKELKALEATAKSLETERDELRDDKLASVHNDIQKVKDQAKDALNRPPGHAGGARRGGAAAVFPARGGGHRHASGPSHTAAFAPGAKGKQGARGGKAGSFGNRAASSPAAQFGAAPKSNNAGFTGGFMQNFGKGFRRGPGHNANQTQSFDAMAGAGFAGAGGPSAGGMLPPGPGYGPGGMQDPSMVGTGFGAGQPYGGLEPYYGQPQQQAGHFPSGASEASQDDLYDPTLGFDPYDPSIDARRRSSLPLPQIPYQPPQAKLPASNTSTALNPANPEFVPSTGSNHASPVISKNASASSARTTPVTAASTALPAHTAVAQSPTAGVASVEHSPTSSSRFAFPLARHLPTAGGATSSLTSKSSSSALAAANSAGGGAGAGLTLPPGSDMNVLPSGGMGSNLFAMAPSGAASPFARHSPLLPQSMDGAAGTAFAGASPRFGGMALHSQQGSGSDEAASSGLSSAPFGAAAKFGPLDYDPSLEGFGPAPGLAGGLGSSGNPNLPPFSSAGMTSIFGASDTWSAPGLPVGSALGASTAPSSGWLTSSPPLGSGSAAGGAGDIWSAPALPGVPQLRSKMSMSELGATTSSPIGASAATASAGAGQFGAFGGVRGLGAIGQSAIASVPSRSSPLASPVAASPTTRAKTDAEPEPASKPTAEEPPAAGAGESTHE